MTVYEDDKTHQAYYVFDRTVKPDMALTAIARQTHQAKSKLKVIYAWINDYEMFFLKRETFFHRQN